MTGLSQEGIAMLSRYENTYQRTPRLGGYAVTFIAGLVAGFVLITVASNYAAIGYRAADGCSETVSQVSDNHGMTLADWDSVADLRDTLERMGR